MSTSIFMVVNNDTNNYEPFGLFSSKELAERYIRAFSQGEVVLNFDVEELDLDQHKKEINLKMVPYAIELSGDGKCKSATIHSNPSSFELCKINQPPYNDEHDTFYTCVWGYSENHAIKEARKILFNTIY